MNPWPGSGANVVQGSIVPNQLNAETRVLLRQHAQRLMKLAMEAFSEHNDNLAKKLRDEADVVNRILDGI